MNDMSYFEKIINYLKTNDIDYILMSNKDMLHAYKYPYDLRLSYSKTSFYRISWCVWSEIKSPEIKINYAAAEDEALELIQKINDEFKNRLSSIHYIKERLLI